MVGEDVRMITHHVVRSPDGEEFRGWPLAAAIGADPGVQTGLAAAVLVEREGAQVVVPMCVSLLGARAVRSPRAKARPALAPTAAHVLSELRYLRDYLAPCAPLVVVVCEDWFIGPNGSTVRDTARGFYQVQGAAEQLGLPFRAVPHGTWKLHALGSARLPSADAARAYAATAAGWCGDAAPDRWLPRGTAPPAEADDAAALCIAHWYLSSEVR